MHGIFILTIIIEKNLVEQTYLTLVTLPPTIKVSMTFVVDILLGVEVTLTSPFIFSKVNAKTRRIINALRFTLF